MARTAGKKQAPAKVEEDDDADGWDDAVVDADGKDAEADLRLRDWRDVERYREMKELRGLVDDDYGLEEIFHVPLRPRDAKAKANARLVPAKPLPKGAAAKALAKAAAAVPAAPAARTAKPAPVMAKTPAKPDKAPPAKPAPAKARTALAQVKAAPARKAPPAKLKAKAKKK